MKRHAYNKRALRTMTPAARHGRALLEILVSTRAKSQPQSSFVQAAHLVRMGADLTLLHNGRTALQLVAGMKPAPRVTELAVVLLDAGAAVEGDARAGRPTPLTLAAQRGNEDLARLLVARGAQLDGRAPDPSPLMAAVLRDDVALAQWLLAAGADIHCARDDGQDALMLAIAKGNERPVRLLLDGGTALTRKDAKGRTAAMIAAECHVALSAAVNLWEGQLLLGVKDAARQLREARPRLAALTRIEGMLAQEPQCRAAIEMTRAAQEGRKAAHQGWQGDKARFSLGKKEGP